jgi:tetratricopeptide (TPR) repeat protein
MENQTNSEGAEKTPAKVRDMNSSSNAMNGLLSFFNANRKVVIYGGGGLLAVILLLGGYKLYQGSKDADAQKDIIIPEYMFGIDSTKMALKGLEGVADDYPGTKTANRAHYEIGVSLLHQGKYQEAIDELEKFSSNSINIMPLAYGALGDAYSQLKEYDKAARYYKKAATFSDNPFVSPYYYRKAGLVLEIALKEYDEALKMYTIVKDKYKTTSFATDIDKYINRAQSKVDNK